MKRHNGSSLLSNGCDENTENDGLGSMALEDLLSKYKALTSNPSTTKQRKEKKNTYRKL
jgi:hypothetical protein